MSPVNNNDLKLYLPIATPSRDDAAVVDESGQLDDLFPKGKTLVAIYEPKPPVLVTVPACIRHEVLFPHPDDRSGEFRGVCQNCGGLFVRVEP